MEFKGDEPGKRSSAKLNEPGSTTVIELELYDELSKFSALSPEEQKNELERIAQANAAEAHQTAVAGEQGGELEPVSIATEDGSMVTDSSDKREGTGPLADMVSGVDLSVQTTLRCESCGAASTAEDLFCLSCGELMGVVDW